MELQLESLSARDIAITWLTEYRQAVYAGDAHAVAKTLLPNGWLRDVLTWTWDYRALEGSKKVVTYLQDNLRPGQIAELRLVEDAYCVPVHDAVTEGIEAVFTYETAVAHGRGYTRLARDEEGSWRALSVCMMVVDLKGHEEASHELGIYGGHTLAWSDVYRDRILKIEASPQVLISECIRRRTS